jgi:hypothetical protein
MNQMMSSGLSSCRCTVILLLSAFQAILYYTFRFLWNIVIQFICQISFLHFLAILQNTCVANYSAKWTLILRIVKLYYNDCSSQEEGRYRVVAKHSTQFSFISSAGFSKYLGVTFE